MSKLLYKDKPLIGIDISSSSIKAMSVDPKKQTVNGYGSIDLDPIRAKKSLETEGDSYLADSLKLLMSDNITGSFNTNDVAIALPTDRTFCRTFTLPFSVENTLKEAVILEADQYIPIPSSSLYIDYEVIERNRSKKLITVLMSAISKTIVDNTVASVTKAGLRPIVLEPSISSATRLLAITEDATLPTVVVDIGPTSTDIAILNKGSLRVTGGLPVGGSTFTIDIAKKLNIPLENAHQLKVLNGLSAGPRQQKIKEAMSPSLERILAEVKKVIRYYTERINSEQKLQQLLVIGSGSNVPGIGEYFTENLIIAARVASPWQKLDFAKLQEPPKQVRPRYLTAAGLASIQPGKIWR